LKFGKVGNGFSVLLLAIPTEREVFYGGKLYVGPTFFPPKYFVGLLTGMGLVITARFYFKNSFLNGNILSTLVFFQFHVFYNSI